MMINRRNWNSGILTLNTLSRYRNNPLNKNFRFHGQTVGDNLGRIKIGREIG